MTCRIAPLPERIMFGKMIRLKYNLCVGLSILASVLSPSTGQEACNQLTSCSCSNSEGTIDLSPLAKTGTAAFMDQPDTSGNFFYSWNPCNDFTEGSAVSASCTNVAACQSDNTGQNYYNLGDQKSAKFVLDDSKGLTLQYSATTDIERTAIVTLKCDQSVDSKLDVAGEDPGATGHYLYTLTSKYACPSGGGSGGVGGSLSVGSIIVIAFFGLCIMYLAIGSSYMAFIRKARGFEIVPNFDLWSRVFGYMRDGIFFAFTCGRRAHYGKI